MLQTSNQRQAEIDRFLSELQQSIDTATLSRSNCIVLSDDFNNPYTVWDSNHVHSELYNILINLVNFNGLHQDITEPTRLGNILDLIITNEPTHCVEYGFMEPPDPFLDDNMILLNYHLLTLRKHRSKDKFGIMTGGIMNPLSGICGILNWESFTKGKQL